MHPAAVQLTLASSEVGWDGRKHTGVGNISVLEKFQKGRNEGLKEGHKNAGSLRVRGPLGPDRVTSFLQLKDGRCSGSNPGQMSRASEEAEFSAPEGLGCQGQGPWKEGGPGTQDGNIWAQAPVLNATPSEISGPLTYLSLSC